MIGLAVETVAAGNAAGVDHPFAVVGGGQAFLSQTRRHERGLSLVAGEGVGGALFGPLRQEMLGDGVVEIIAAQGRVATGSQHLEDAIFHAQQGHIESATAEIVDREHAFGALVQPVGHGCRRGLVDQPQHLEPGEPGGVAGGGAGGIVEIGRHRDHGALHAAVERGFGTDFQRPQNIGRDFHWGQGPPPHLQPHHAAVIVSVLARRQFERQGPGQGFDVFGPPAHQPFDGTDHRFGFPEQGLARRFSHQRKGACVFAVGHHRGHQQ